jgi:hypothetical protein
LRRTGSDLHDHPIPLVAVAKKTTRTRASSKSRTASAGEDLEQLPQQNETWQGGAARITEIAGVPPEMASPGADLSLVLWAEEGSGFVVAGNMVEPDALPDAVAELLLHAMRTPMAGAPRRPRAVVLRSQEQAAAVREWLGAAGIQIRVEAELPLWDAVVRDFAETIAAAAPEASYLEGENVTPEQVGDFFRAAADYYQAAPWQVVEDQPFELRLPHREEPVYATVMGSGGMEYGLAVHFSAEAVAAIFDETRTPHEFPDALAVTFDREDELPDRMREERRRHRWKVAGPAAFPIPMRSLPPAHIRDADAGEIEVLTIALDAIRDFTSRHRDRLIGWDTVEDVVEVAGVGPVHVVFPARITGTEVSATLAHLRELEEEFGIDATAEGEGGLTPLLTEMQRRILDLPGAAEVINRLSWSFFRNRRPEYLLDEGELGLEQGTARFLEWAYYFAPLPPDDGTLAQYAAEEAYDLPASERAELERFSRPIFGVWDVERVEKGKGMTLRSVFDRARYRVRERMGSYQIKKGWTLFGPLFPVSEDEWVLGTMSPSPSSARKQKGWKELAEIPGDRLALLIESTLHGADVEWVHDLERRRDVKEVWDELRDDLGDWLYSYAYLERKIREMDSPTELMQAVADRGEWWTDAELEVTAALLMQAWNVTTRPELGGLSPARMRDEVSTAGPEEERIIAMMGPALMEAVMLNPPRSAAQIQKTIERHARKWLTTPHPELGGLTPVQAIEADRRRRGTLDDWDGVDGIIQGLRLLGAPI